MAKFFIFFLFLLNPLFANQEYPFFGLTTSYNKISFISDSNLSNPTETTFGLRYGKQTQDYRTSFTLAGNGNYQTFDMQTDVFLLDNMFGMPEIRPYLGATLGYMHYDDNLLNGYTKSISSDTNNTKSSSTNNIFYGVNFGFVFYITDNIDMDIAYHYYFVDRLEPLDKMQGTSFSLHYFY